MEKALQEEFLPALFLGEDTTIPGRSIAGFMVKRSDIAIPDPTLTSQGNWMLSCVVSGQLVADLQGRVKFRSGDHGQLLRYGRADIRRHNSYKAGEGGGGVSGCPGTLPGRCLPSMPSTEDGYMYFGGSVHIQWDGAWISGMEV